MEALNPITAFLMKASDPIAAPSLKALDSITAPSLEAVDSITAPLIETEDLNAAFCVIKHGNLDSCMEPINTNEEHMNPNPQEKHSSSIVQGLTNHHDDQYIPKVGMMFDSEDELYDYFHRYAYKIGFGIRKLSTRTKGEGATTYYSLGCAKGGVYVSKTKGVGQLSTKTGCKSKIRVIAYGDGRCAISRVFLEHNHALSLKKSRFQRSHKKMNSYAKRRLELNDSAGIPLNKSFHSLVVEAKGYDNLPFDERDCRNYIAKVRQLRLGSGDAEALRNYFVRMQRRSSNFSM